MGEVGGARDACDLRQISENERETERERERERARDRDRERAQPDQVMDCAKNRLRGY